MNKKLRIAVYRSSSLGDFIISLPALNLLRKTFPSSEIIFFTHSNRSKKMKKKLETYKAIDLPWKFLAESLKVKFVKITFPNFFDFLKISLKNFFHSPDIIIFFTDEGASLQQRIKKYFYLKFLIGLRSKTFGMYWTKSRYSNPGNNIHRTLGFARFYSQMKNVSLRKIEHLLTYPEVKKLNIFELSKKFKIDNKLFSENIKRKVITIDPGSLLSFKNWGLENFLILVDEILLFGPNYKIIFVGIKLSQEDTFKINKFLTIKKNIINLLGMTSLEELYTIFSYSYLHICNDGGSAHLADMAGMKVISIRTSVDAKGIIEPWHNRNNSIIADIECSPCYSFDCCPLSNNFTPCLDKISVQKVFTKFKEIIA